MKLKIFTTLILCFIFTNVCFPQSGSKIESVLSSIEKNNPSIKADKQMGIAKNYEYQTNLSPYDPFIRFNYLFGNPSEVGNQTEFTFSQILDFPTVYSKKSRLSDLQIKQTGHILSAKKKDILLDAKKVCIKLIYNYKLLSQINIRKENTEKLIEDFKKSLESGNGNILDVNKAQLTLIEINKENLKITSVINLLNQHLTELNGGTPIIFSDTVYPPVPAEINFTQLEQDFEANDPDRLLFEQEILVAKQQVEVQKALSLPKLEFGYYYQGNKGVDFQGFQTGISIPLWENNNKVEMQKARMLYADLELKSHMNEHYFEIKHLHENYTSLKEILLQYTETLGLYSNQSLLDKSLSLGQISSIEYFMELSFYYNAYENYLETEKDLNLVVAEMYKYKL